MSLQNLRKEKGFTQKELADESGINLRTLQEYEGGRKLIDNAHVETLLNLANALEVPFYEILKNGNLKTGIIKNLKGDYKMKNFELTQDRMDIIATYMDDDLRERLHGKLAPCDPMEFLRAYVKTNEDPDFLDVLKNEFSDVYEEL